MRNRNRNPFANGGNGANGGQCVSCEEPHPCDSDEHDLRFLCLTSPGVPLYVDSALGQSNADALAHARQLAEAFAPVMVFVAGVIGPSVVPTLHLFFEPPVTPTGMERREVFGFNQNGALWFSVRAFGTLHARLPSVWLPECTGFWLVTLAHELAHNLAPLHDMKHATLTERVLETFVPAVVRGHVQYALREQQQQQQQQQRQNGGLHANGTARVQRGMPQPRW